MGLRKLFITTMLILLAGVGVGVAQDSLTPPTVPAPATQGVSPAPDLPSPGAGEALTRQDLDAWLDGMVPYALRTGDLAGAVIVVVKDGQVLTSRGYGYADVEDRTPVDPASTLFRPGSVSKLFTWTAVMQLVEQGKIDLDADVNQYLDFEIPAKHGRPVTMRQIMTHTAGFEEQGKGLIFFDAEDIQPLGPFLASNIPDRIFEPGTTPAYSNYATALAGYIVQRLSGEPFDDYVDRHIFTPLGMENSTMRQPLPERLQGQMATGYRLGSGEGQEFEIVGPAPAGSLSSTGNDMANFMIAHLQNGEFNGNRILQAETARMMHDTPLTLMPPLNRMQLGFYESDINGRDVISHGGDTMFFHSELHLFLDENVGFFLSVNSTGRDGAAGTIRTILFEEFADRYFPGPEITTSVDQETAVEHARMLAGNWQPSRRFASSFMAIGGLLSQVTIAPDGEGGLVIPFLQGEDGQPRQWVEVEPFVWKDRNSHEVLAAKVVDGKVVRVAVGSWAPFTVFDRVPASVSASWLLPALYFALAVLALTVLLWPIRALVRRYYRAPLGLTGRVLLAHRLSRLFALLILAVFLGWIWAISAMSSDLTLFSSAMDPWLWLLQIAGLIAFVGGTGVMAWNVWVAFHAKRRWTARLWSICLLIAALVLLWIALQFNLLAFSVQF
ncbi:serine hydrolase domain-containing protein [Sphingosinithalassobacter sp. LHW66-3]|uniref:serine hydrolase domain-containing protein n=1 Tax=Sphingosinithalassobacter sp. LHW66-3 TaxID=3424718 RepID=UPI003D6A2534